MNNKKNNTKKPMRRVLIIALALSLLVVSVLVTYAIFTGSIFTQRVIGAYADSSDNFTLNYLKTGNAKDNIVMVYTTDSEQGASVYMTICNYPQGNQTLYSRMDIHYTLTAELVEDTGSGNYVAVGVIDSVYTVSIDDVNVLNDVVVLENGATNTTIPQTESITLDGRQPSTDIYQIVFSKQFNTSPNIYLRVTATPDGSFPTITGIFKPTVKAVGATNNWTGTFRDNTASSATLYDGYNYLISGVGKGTVTISWDPTKISLSYVSQKMLLTVDSSATLVVGSSSVLSSITFPVDSDEEDRYDLQFYKAVTSSAVWVPNSSGTTDLSIDGDVLVTFNFVES